MLFDCVIREDILHSLQNNQASLILFGSFIVSLYKIIKYHSDNVCKQSYSYRKCG